MTDKKTDQPSELSDQALDDAAGGVDAKRDHDYVGNFNFKVEIEGVTQGAFKAIDGLRAEVVTTSFDKVTTEK